MDYLSLLPDDIILEIFSYFDQKNIENIINVFLAFSGKNCLICSKRISKKKIYNLLYNLFYNNVENHNEKLIFFKFKCEKFITYCINKYVNYEFFHKDDYEKIKQNIYKCMQYNDILNCTLIEDDYILLEQLFELNDNNDELYKTKDKIISDEIYDKVDYFIKLLYTNNVKNSKILINVDNIRKFILELFKKININIKFEKRI